MPYRYKDVGGSKQPISPNNTPSAQGKLVLGNFKNQPPPRQPYTYPPRQPYTYPPQQPGQVYNPNMPFQAPRKRHRRNPVLRLGCFTMLALMAIVIVLAIITVPRVLAF